MVDRFFCTYLKDLAKPSPSTSFSSRPFYLQPFLRFSFHEKNIAVGKTYICGMIGFLKNIFVCSVLFSLPFLLAACDSGSDKNAESADDAELSDAAIAEEVDFVATIYEDLPVCTDNRVGSTAYVKDEKNAYVCDGDDWTEDASLTDLIEREQEDKSLVESGQIIEFSSSSFFLLATSSSFVMATQCKTDSTDTCEYDALIDSRDGQIYKTVKIGSQWWMAENLNFAYLQPTRTLDSSSFCYHDSLEYCEKYGRLYLWSAAMDSTGVYSTNGKGCGYDTIGTLKFPVRGTCPEGWHLPDIGEWKILLQAVGSLPDLEEVYSLWSEKYIPKKTRSLSEWYSSKYGLEAFGFFVPPAGTFYEDLYDRSGTFSDEGRYANFWSSTGYGKVDACTFNVLCAYGAVYHDDFSKNNAFSVRCLKD